MPNFSQVLVTDFDGTITRHDFYKLAVERFLTPADLAPWDDYRTGKITHFQAIQSIFHRIREPESKVLELIRDMRVDPRLSDTVKKLNDAAWDVVIASAGCEWYVRRILADSGTDITLYANPGDYPEGGPLNMRAAPDSTFYCTEMGVDKAGIVRHYLDRGMKVAYAGDGYTDEAAAMLVPDNLRFARADLADTLKKRGVAFHSFTIWSEVADTLLNMQNAPTGERNAK